MCTPAEWLHFLDGDSCQTACDNPAVQGSTALMVHPHYGYTSEDNADAPSALWRREGTPATSLSHQTHLKADKSRCEHTVGGSFAQSICNAAMVGRQGIQS